MVKSINYTNDWQSGLIVINKIKYIDLLEDTMKTDSHFSSKLTTIWDLLIEAYLE